MCVCVCVCARVCACACACACVPAVTAVMVMRVQLTASIGCQKHVAIVNFDLFADPPYYSITGNAQCHIRSSHVPYSG